MPRIPKDDLDNTLLNTTSSAGSFPTLNQNTTGTAANVTGTVPVGNGGTGLTTLTTGTLLTASSSSTMASVKTAPSGVIVGTSDTQTVTNKRITKRTSTAASNAAPSYNTDSLDGASLTAQAANITSVTLTGTPTDKQTFWLDITATGSFTLTLGTNFEASSVALPTAITTARLDIGCVWNVVTSKWRVVATA